MVKPDQRVSNASVATERPGRYGKQLVSHLSRKVAGDWSGATASGWLQFPSGRADLVGGVGVLKLTVRAVPEELADIEEAVGGHLVRFATQEALEVRWTREDGTPGTVQRREAHS